MGSMNMPSELQNASIYTDFSGLNKLRRQAREHSGATLRQAARQFEGIFVQMVLKSMREASFGDGLFDSSQSRFYRDMFDQQISLNLSSQRGLGLADMMVKQLQRSVPASPAAGSGHTANTADDDRRHSLINAPRRFIVPGRAAPAAQAVGEAGAANAGPAAGSTQGFFAKPEDFVKALWQHAKQVAAELGLAPEAIVAQAALETGWGKHMLRQSDGSSSYNLFGIKADQRWDGKRVAANSLEFKDGVMKQERSVFRAYTSIADSVADYVKFLKSDPRYRPALQGGLDATGFARELSRAGYATDPDYAQKINAILNGSTFKRALSELNI